MTHNPRNAFRKALDTIKEMKAESADPERLHMNMETEIFNLLEILASSPEEKTLVWSIIHEYEDADIWYA